METHQLSALARQFVIHGKRFGELHPHDWLMWESGEWQVPKGNIATAITLNDGVDSKPKKPTAGDPLCFAMPARVEGTMVSVGRAEGNDFVLSDATVSRRHCTLVFRGTGWMVTPTYERQAVELDGVSVQFGQWVPFSPGKRLKLGHLELSLYTAPALMVRLAQLAQQARRA